eukprot:scaffold54091_cov63-Phaeocystis_antarctica.AAC.1
MARDSPESGDREQVQEEADDAGCARNANFASNPEEQRWAGAGSEAIARSSGPEGSARDGSQDISTRENASGSG